MFSSPLKSQYDGKGGMIAHLSLNQECHITKEEWLNQDIVLPGVTIKKFIKSISDKEGAHSDPDIEEIIKKMNGIKIGKEETYMYVIVAIGEYIAGIIHEIVVKEDLREKFKYLFQKNYEK
jgi:hypothetical protein